MVRSSEWNLDASTLSPKRRVAQRVKKANEKANEQQFDTIFIFISRAGKDASRRGAPEKKQGNVSFPCCPPYPNKDKKRPKKQLYEISRFKNTTKTTANTQNTKTQKEGSC
jgi:hypothetical protein